MGRKSTFFNVFYGGIVVIATVLSFQANGQISINKFTTSYTQNFDGLPASGTGTWVSGTFYFPGWLLSRTIPTTTTLLTGTGSSNAGGLYSFGAAGSTDRALGAVSSGNAAVGEFAWGLLVQNNTGSTITALNISFTGEQWRSSSTSAPQQATTFWYGTNSDATKFELFSKSDAGWIKVPELEFYGPVYFSSPGTVNGNLPENRKFLTASIPVNIPNGHYFMLRWKDLNDPYDDHGLAIDDFSMTWSTAATSGPTILPVELARFTAKLVAGGVGLNWLTASEDGNDHFAVERSSNGRSFEQIGRVKGNGTRKVQTSYSFTDTDPLEGASYYRLKQVDEDGSYTYSAIVSVQVKQAATSLILYPTIVTDQLKVAVPYKDASLLEVYDPVGRLVLSQQVRVVGGVHTVNVSRLTSGRYTLRIQNQMGQQTASHFLKR